MKNNRGFSLLELIVVIAIMSVAMTIGGFSLSYILSTRSKQCAAEINAGLEVARIAGLSKSGSNNKIQIYKKDDGVYIKKLWEGNEEKIGSSRINVTFDYVLSGAGGAADSNVSGTLGVSNFGTPANPVEISFKRESGGIAEPIKGNIVITVSGNKTYTITCYKLTGKTVLN